MKGSHYIFTFFKLAIIMTYCDHRVQLKWWHGVSQKKKSNDTEKRRRPQSLIEDWKRWYILSECSIIILLSTASNYCNLAIFNFLFFFEKVYIQLDEDWKVTSRIRLYKSICKLKMIYLYTCYIEQYYTCIFLKSGEVCMGDIMISAAW